MGAEKGTTWEVPNRLSRIRPARQFCLPQSTLQCRRRTTAKGGIHGRSHLGRGFRQTSVSRSVIKITRERTILRLGSASCTLSINAARANREPIQRETALGPVPRLQRKAHLSQIGCRLPACCWQWAASSLSWRAGSFVSCRKSALPQLLLLCT